MFLRRPQCRRVLDEWEGAVRNGARYSEGWNGKYFDPYLFIGVFYLLFMPRDTYHYSHFSCKRQKMSRDAVQAPEEEEDEVKVIPETDDEDSTDLHHSTRVSNIAEQETVPYENCVEEKTNTKPDCHLKPNSDVLEPPEMPDEDDEALKLVREIFFT